MPMPEILGWTVTWCGWREPANQIIVIGYWLARRETDWSYYGVAAATGGAITIMRSAFDTLDTSFLAGWPRLTIASPGDEREDAKRRAWALLSAHLDKIDAGYSMNGQ